MGAPAPHSHLWHQHQPLQLMNLCVVCPTLYCSVQLLCLTRNQFQSKLGDLSALRSMWRFEALRRVPLLCTLPPDLMNRLAVALVSEQFQPGQEVISEVRKACKEQGTRAARMARKHRNQPAHLPAPASRQCILPVSPAGREGREVLHHRVWPPWRVQGGRLPTSSQASLHLSCSARRGACPTQARVNRHCGVPHGTHHCLVCL